MMNVHAAEQESRNKKMYTKDSARIECQYCFYFEANRKFNQISTMISLKIIRACFCSCSHYQSMTVQEKQSKRFSRELKYSPQISKLVQTQFAQFLNNLVEYSSELTYFAINAFQTSSLRRVQMNTMVM